MLRVGLKARQPHARALWLVAGIGVTAAFGLAINTCFGGVQRTTGEIAFSRFAKDASQSGIFVIAPSGERERQLTHVVPAQYGGNWSDDAPRWAPDGSRILFTRCAEEVCESWTIGPDGRDLRRLGAACREVPPLCEDRTEATWSPNGKLIALRRDWGLPARDDPQFSDLYIMDRDGRHLRRLTRFTPYSGETAYPAWSPDGTQVAFTRIHSSTNHPQDRSAVFVVGANGQRLRRVTPWRSWRLGADFSRDWAPDGRWILFEARASLYVVHPDGGGMRRVVAFAPKSLIFNASFSPDGRWILFSSYTATTPSRIYLVRFDGTGLRRVGDFASGEVVGSPSFSPDGGRIVFSKLIFSHEADPRSGHEGIFQMRTDGSELHAVTDSEATVDTWPDWGPGE